LERQTATAKGDGRTPSKTLVPTSAVTAVRNKYVPEAPVELGDRGQVEWQKIWEAGFWLKAEQDYAWIEQIAYAYDQIKEFREKVKEDGLVVTGYAGQVVAHPLIAEIRKCEATIRECLSKIGFSPTDRARLGIMEAKAQTALQQMIEAQRQNAG